MEILEQRQGAVTVLKPQGALAGQDSEQFEGRLKEVLGTSLGRFVLDASEIAYVDSKALEALLDATERLGDSGQALRLCGANELVREVLDLTDLARFFEHYQDVNSAVRSFL